MAIALDASTPVAVQSNPATLTTASFTPPLDACLYILIGINSSSSATAPDHISSVTVSGGASTPTQLSTFGTADGNDAIAYLYTAKVTSSIAMTVSAAQTSTSTTVRFGFLRVLVVTGADISTTTSMVGAKGGARGRTTNLTTSTPPASYSSTRDGSWGWVLYTDWSASALPTAGTAQTRESGYLQTGQVTYAAIKQNSTTTTSGTTVTMSTTAPTTGLQLSFIYFEMMPAVSGETVTVDKWHPEANRQYTFRNEVIPY